MVIETSAPGRVEKGGPGMAKSREGEEGEVDDEKERTATTKAKEERRGGRAWVVVRV